MVSHAVWKTWPSGLSNDKNLSLRPRFLSTESLGPCFSHGMGDHDQILQLMFQDGGVDDLISLVLTPRHKPDALSITRWVPRLTFTVRSVRELRILVFVPCQFASMTVEFLLCCSQCHCPLMLNGWGPCWCLVSLRPWPLSSYFAAHNVTVHWCWMDEVHVDALSVCVHDRWVPTLLLTMSLSTDAEWMRSMLMPCQFASMTVEFLLCCSHCHCPLMLNGWGPCWCLVSLRPWPLSSYFAAHNVTVHWCWMDEVHVDALSVCVHDRWVPTLLLTMSLSTDAEWMRSMLMPCQFASMTVEFLLCCSQCHCPLMLNGWGPCWCLVSLRPWPLSSYFAAHIVTVHWCWMDEVHVDALSVCVHDRWVPTLLLTMSLSTDAEWMRSMLMPCQFASMTVEFLLCCSHCHCPLMLNGWGPCWCLVSLRPWPLSSYFAAHNVTVHWCWMDEVHVDALSVCVHDRWVPTLLLTLSLSTDAEWMRSMLMPCQFASMTVEFLLCCSQCHCPLMLNGWGPCWCLVSLRPWPLSSYFAAHIVTVHWCWVDEVNVDALSVCVHDRWVPTLLLTLSLSTDAEWMRSMLMPCQFASMTVEFLLCCSHCHCPLMLSGWGECWCLARLASIACCVPTLICVVRPPMTRLTLTDIAMSLVNWDRDEIPSWIQCNYTCTGLNRKNNI